MQVAISISEGRLSSAALMRRLRSNSRKNRIYKVFREVGRSVRTVALLRYLADPQLRARITAATNKVESYNGFSHWLAFGNNGVLADNDPAEQEKLIKLNTLLANLVIFHNALDIMDVVRKLVAEGWLITAGQLGAMSPYIRAHISRFGAYATDDLARQPEAFNPVLKEVDFTAFSQAELTAVKPLTDVSPAANKPDGVAAASVMEAAAILQRPQTPRATPSTATCAPAVSTRSPATCPPATDSTTLRLGTRRRTSSHR